MGTERKWARWAQRKSGCLQGKRAFLPPDFESVKTRNVWADVRWDVNETGGQCHRTQEEKTFCFVLFFLFKARQITVCLLAAVWVVSTTPSVRPGGLKVPLHAFSSYAGLRRFTWKLSISWSTEHYRLSHRNLTSQKKIKINKPKKKKKDHRLVVHHQKCKTRKINYLDDKKNGENLLFFFFLFF